MKFMITWSISTGNYKAAVQRFLATGAPVPEGLKGLGRWHAVGSSRGWFLVEGDPDAVMQHYSEWADVCDINVFPVVDDAQAAAAISKVHG